MQHICMKGRAEAVPVVPGVARRLPSVSFGPYLLLGTVPWLLLATATRMHGRHTEGGLGLLVLLIAQFALFIAFLVASNRMIRLFGGSTALDRLSFNEQFALGRGIIWRLLGLFLAANLLAVWAGMGKLTAAFLWFGFDGIAFDWHRNILLLWSPLVAVIAYLMVVEKGAGREPGFGSVLRQMRDRWRYLLPAMLAIMALQIVSNTIQHFAGFIMEPLYVQLTLSVPKNLMYLGFFFCFAYIRLWATVAILTYALRLSYRQSPSTGAAPVNEQNAD